MFNRAKYNHCALFFHLHTYAMVERKSGLASLNCCFVSQLSHALSQLFKVFLFFCVALMYLAHVWLFSCKLYISSIKFVDNKSICPFTNQIYDLTWSKALLNHCFFHPIFRQTSENVGFKIHALQEHVFATRIVHDVNVNWHFFRKKIKTKNLKKSAFYVAEKSINWFADK